MKVYSWNVNSLRNCENNFLEFLNTYSPDIVFIQELRAHPDQLSFFLKFVNGYECVFNDSGRLGYAGTAVYYKSSLNPSLVTNRLGNKILDTEGRAIYMVVGDYHLFNFYTPNGNMSEERLKFKLEYYDEILKLMKKLTKEGKKIILGGDLNVGYTDLDKYNLVKNVSGCLPSERKWFKDVLDVGFLDSLREFYKQGGLYTWWHLRDPKRLQNNGWRFDYFLVSKNIKDDLKGAGILKDVYGSDHCPIWVEIEV